MQLAQVHVPEAQERQTNWMSEFGAEKGLLQGHARRQVAHALKNPKLPKGFWQSTFKSQVGREGSVQGLWAAHAQFSDWRVEREQGGVTWVSIISS